ncbi:MAG TPA: hypothetical protein VLK33_16965 [Terriglobales bacterium]|nr:hypothetical protein [Terriglobales bacterium]
MNIKEYISSGIIESYVLGLASSEEVAEFEKLCTEYPELVAARTSFEIAKQFYLAVQSTGAWFELLTSWEKDRPEEDASYRDPDKGQTVRQQLQFVDLAKRRSISCPGTNDPRPAKRGEARRWWFAAAAD